MAEICHVVKRYNISLLRMDRFEQNSAA